MDVRGKRKSTLNSEDGLEKRSKEDETAEQDNRLTLSDVLHLDPVTREIFKYFPHSHLPRLQKVCIDFKEIIGSYMRNESQVSIAKFCPSLKFPDTTENIPFTRLQKLDLKKCIEWLAKYCPNLREITDLFLEPEQAQMFQNLSTLKLDIRLNDPDDENANWEQIRKLIANTPNLENLSIQGQLSDSPTSFFGDSIEAFPKHLKVLDLGLAYVSEDGHELWFNPNSVVNISQITEIAFPQVRRVPKLFAQHSSFSKFLKKGCNLRRITWRNNMVNVGSDWLPAPEQIPHFERLSFPSVSCIPVDEGTLGKIGRQLKSLSIVNETPCRTDLRFLRLARVWFRAFAPRIAEMCPNITHLSLIWLADKESGPNFEDVLGSMVNLKSLFLHQLHPENCNQMCQFLNEAKNCPELKELKASVSDLLQPRSRVEGIVNLNRKIETLGIKISGNIQISLDCGPNLRSSIKYLEFSVQEEKLPVLNLLTGLLEDCRSLKRASLPFRENSATGRKIQNYVQESLPELKYLYFLQ